MGSSSCEQSCLDIWWLGWSGGWNLQTFGGILIWADKESIKGEAGKVAVGEGTYSTWFLSNANNNSADRAVPNAFFVVISFREALSLIKTPSKALSQIR